MNKKEIINNAHEYCTRKYTQNKENSTNILVDRESYEIAFDAYIECYMSCLQTYAAKQAVAFAKWIRENCVEVPKTKGLYYTVHELHPDTYTTEQLYEIFKEQGV